jgi:hypothetical protein
LFPCLFFLIFNFLLFWSLARSSSSSCILCNCCPFRPAAVCCCPSCCLGPPGNVILPSRWRSPPLPAVSSQSMLSSTKSN